jgi:Mg2+-importing ATPase
MATSANFGNMFSMAGISFFLPFLPLLPEQILFLNFMTDLPEMTIANDRVDEELLERPGRWNIQFIRKFMLRFGPLSSIFDFITFGILIYVLKASEATFRTGWFLESIISASLIVLVVRTHRPFFKSLPGKSLFIATIFVCVVSLLIPYTPIKDILKFQPLPVSIILIIFVIIFFYIFMAELTKKAFYKKIDH